MLPSEHSEALNYYLSINKYHKYVGTTATDVIAREAYLIATAQEPSAAVTVVPNKGHHYLLVAGVLCQPDPSLGATTVNGVWIHDPAGTAGQLPIYVASNAWMDVFEEYWDEDGTFGYTHVEDPPPGDDRLDHLPPLTASDLYDHQQPVSSTFMAENAAVSAVAAPGERGRSPFLASYSMMCILEQCQE